VHLDIQNTTDWFNDPNSFEMMNQTRRYTDYWWYIRRSTKIFFSAKRRVGAERRKVHRFQESAWSKKRDYWSKQNGCWYSIVSILALVDIRKKKRLFFSI